MSQENVEIVHAAYEAFSHRNREKLLSAMAPDVVVDMSRSLGPEAGMYHGREGFDRLLDAYWDSFETFLIVPVELLPVGDRVVAVTQGQGRGRGSGAVAAASAAQVWRLDNGKIAAWTAYQDKAEALEAVGLAE